MEDILKQKKKCSFFIKISKIGPRRIDHLIEGLVPVESKAPAKLKDVYFTLAINYFEADSIETGMLVNFEARSLEFIS